MKQKNTPRWKITLPLLTFCLSSFLSHAEHPTPEPWVNLLQGEQLHTLWKPANSDNNKKEIGARWQLKDGILSLDRGRKGHGGNIETKEKYYNFELEFQFCIQPNCNSGIKYRQDNGVGLEYQLIDDERYHDNSLTHRTAELYEIQEEQHPRKLKPAGQWNTARIIAKDHSIEHWLNGEKVLQITYGSAEWKTRFEKSKYHKKMKLKDFGSHTAPIHLQDHRDTDISFKNMRIRKL